MRKKIQDMTKNLDINMCYAFVSCNDKKNKLLTFSDLGLLILRSSGG